MGAPATSLPRSIRLMRISRTMTWGRERGPPFLETAFFFSGGPLVDRGSREMERPSTRNHSTSKIPARSAAGFREISALRASSHAPSPSERTTRSAIAEKGNRPSSPSRVTRYSPLSAVADATSPARRFLAQRVCNPAQTRTRKRMNPRAEKRSHRSPFTHRGRFFIFVLFSDI